MILPKEGYADGGSGLKTRIDDDRIIIMKTTRHHAREIALQALFQLDIQKSDKRFEIDPILAPILEENAHPESAVTYARILIQGAWEKHDRYDEMISGVSVRWDLSRMAVVDRNILRIAIYELIEQPEIPVRVVIDEAIELGREFGEAETPQFINGVIDALWKNHPACRIARPAEELTSTSRS